MTEKPGPVQSGQLPPTPISGWQARPRALLLVVGFGCLVALTAVLVVAVLLGGPSWHESANTPLAIQHAEIPQALVGFEQTGEFAIPLESVTALAAAGDRIFVGGDQRVVVLDSNGVLEREIVLNDAPRCIAVAGDDHAFPGRVYIGFANHVEVFTPGGEQTAVWAMPDEGVLITSLAAGMETVFVADAGRKVVYRYSPDGTRLGVIEDRPDDSGEFTGFAIYTQPYFDMTISPDGLLRVVNPGMHRIEAYTQDGRWEKPLNWGRPGAGIDGFVGCCNPTDIDTFADGRFVTAEKYLLRVKVYSDRGELLSVVAGPKDFELPRGHEAKEDPFYSTRSLRIAVDQNNRVLVVDSAVGSLRVFEETED